jgi:hypothetical protein
MAAANASAPANASGDLGFIVLPSQDSADQAFLQGVLPTALGPHSWMRATRAITSLVLVSGAAYTIIGQLYAISGAGSFPNKLSIALPIPSNTRSCPSGASSSRPTGSPDVVNPIGTLKPGIPALVTGLALRR